MSKALVIEGELAREAATIWMLRQVGWNWTAVARVVGTSIDRTRRLERRYQRELDRRARQTCREFYEAAGSWLPVVPAYMNRLYRAGAIPRLGTGDRVLGRSCLGQVGLGSTLFGPLPEDWEERAERDARDDARWRGIDHRRARRRFLVTPRAYRVRTAVDHYVCREDELAVFVRRVRGVRGERVRVNMRMESGDPACPGCGRPMVRVGRHLELRRDRRGYLVDD